MRTLTLATCCTAVALLLACGKADVKAPEIPFAPHGSSYAEKPDFAQLEYQHPLSVEDLYKITPRTSPSSIRSWSTRSTPVSAPGRFPDGPYEGDLFFPHGESGKLRSRRSPAAVSRGCWSMSPARSSI